MMPFRVGIFLCLLLLDDGCQAKLGGDDNKQEELQLVEPHRLLLGLEFIGNEPSGVLKRCQGDCDNDDDCAGSLRCMQRDGGEKVPGCDGNDRGRTDYCYDPNDSNGNPSPPVSSPVSSPVRQPTSGRRFRLKMYWEEGYYWQESRREKFWCMECRRGDCDSGDKLYINECGRGNQYFSFVSLGGKYLIELEGGRYCLERSGRDIYVRNCEEDENMQWWEGSFSSRRFEISPSTSSNLCVTQRHHPKDSEEVELETCRSAASSDTSYWVKY